MALNCSLNALQVPALPGANITAFEVNLVQNYTGVATSKLYIGHPTVSVDNATFCNVTVSYEHIDGNDTVNVETWLPMDNYNGRIQASGGGGWVAGRFQITYASMMGALGEGYATSTTDAGLGQTPDSWALTADGSPNVHALEDLASISLHDQAILTKAVVEDFYGQPAAYAYWNGCSQGGRQGMMLAQRYPDAYDGIHACAPAANWNELFAFTLWPQLVMEWADYVPRPCELDALSKAAIEACDKHDGVYDSMISDDSACDFDALSVVGQAYFCADTNTTETITKEAATIAKATWTGPRTANDDFVWYGTNTGSLLGTSGEGLTTALGPAMTSCSENGTCMGVPLGLGDVWLKYFVEKDANWDYREMTPAEFDRDVAKSIELYDAIIGTNDPDLTSFYESGGKILGFQGMMDQVIPVKGTERYYNAVSKVLPNVGEFYRMFEVPGLLHCSGGNGGQPSNTFDALRAWVENGTVPESLPHLYTPVEGGPEFERLLCPYPQMAVLKKCGREEISPKMTTRAGDYVCV
ncbi:Tannase/feruloyl esterase [Penicillium canescens]|uniref:Carboxylic ester hydrolase n=1 Tax=Penicillium canescens TaxID=5083 RepID=A0AAD6I0D1_PENCN|nr:Tannase/feruloyl esterase [Penicillium canescens]KAJ6026615.1 Tannase/feruloyl esterase [Penicillium canescens]KAJ6039896.1 Tannase/feruloyl esterase [Penicillium canescens]KAJ6067748.1 Tannase/feruloyl esterase [Penicillium canescens]